MCRIGGTAGCKQHTLFWSEVLNDVRNIRLFTLISWISQTSGLNDNRKPLKSKCFLQIHQCKCLDISKSWIIKEINKNLSYLLTSGKHDSTFEYFILFNNYCSDFWKKKTEGGINRKRLPYKSEIWRKKHEEEKENSHIDRNKWCRRRMIEFTAARESIWTHQWHILPLISAFSLYFPFSLYFLSESQSFSLLQSAFISNQNILKKRLLWDVKLSVTSAKKKKAEGQISED